jgi:uncharacterized membrane protein
MSDQILLIILRVLHIGAALFWVGAFFFMNHFIMPALQSAGPDAGKFTALIMRGGRVQRAMAGSAIVTILAGLGMYGYFIAQTDGQWARSNTAMGLGVGAVAALLAFILGLAVNMPGARRMQAIMAEAKGSPSPEQQAELGRIRNRMAAVSRVLSVLLTIAVLSMAVSRYL